MILQDLIDKGLTKPPLWLSSNTHYLTIMGSQAYAVSHDDSDFDVYGFCIPPKDMVFPQGEIPGFGDSENGVRPKFNQWQEHHIVDPSALGGKGRSYDFQIFSIVKYFHLCAECNPNMIDSIYTPTNCVIHTTKIANMVREKRRIFLHRGAWHTFRGYAYAQLHKMTTKNPKGKRKEVRDKFGFDVKYAYHIVRLVQECEMILTEYDLDIQRNNEVLKAIRRGEWTEQQLREWFTAKEKDMEKIYNESKIPYSPDMEAIKKFLVECLEEHYGNLKNCVVLPDRYKQALEEIKQVIFKAGYE